MQGQTPHETSYDRGVWYFIGMKWTILILTFVLKAYAAISTSNSSSNSIDLAWNSFNNKQYKMCVTFGIQAKKIDTITAEPNIVLGRCHERLGNFSAAHSDFAAATQIDSHNSEAWNNRILMSVKDVRLNRAKNELKYFIRFFPNDHRIPGLRKMIQDLDTHLKSGEMTESETRKVLRNIYLNGLKKLK